LLMDLNARIRDVQVFADGAVYVLTEGANGTLLKVTPKPATTARFGQPSAASIPRQGQVGFRASW